MNKKTAVFLGIMLGFMSLVFHTFVVANEQPVLSVMTPHGHIYEVEYHIADEQIYFPLRFTLERLGYDVYWMADEQKILVIGPHEKYSLVIDQPMVVVGDDVIILDDAPTLMHGSTYVPLSFFTDVMKLVFDSDQNVLKTDIPRINRFIRIENFVNEYRIMKHVRQLAKYERLAGMEGEREAARYIYSHLLQHGYSIEIQPFRLYTPYAKRYPTINRLQILGVPNVSFDLSVVANTKNGQVMGELVWYDEAISYKDKIVIIDSYDSYFYEYIELMDQQGALGYVILGDAYQNVTYGIYDNDRIIAVGVERSDKTRLKELMANHGRIYAEIEVQDAKWYTTSSNLIAKKPAMQNPNGDILLITANYDSKPGSVGANNNASGTAVLLELAEIVARYNNHIEIWFVALGAGFSENTGAKYFLSQLPKNIKDRLVGCLHMNMLADATAGDIRLYTVDGRQNAISYFMHRSYERLYGEQLKHQHDASTDHAIFTYAGIPTVLISQDRLKVDHIEHPDSIENIGMHRLAKATRAIVSAVQHMFDPIAPSIAMIQDGYMRGMRRVYDLSLFAPFPFGEPIWQVESRLELRGFSVATTYSMPTIRSMVRWFEDWTVPSDFVYDNFGNLRFIEIHFDQTDIASEHVYARLQEAFGEPDDSFTETVGWRTIFGNYYHYNTDQNKMHVYPYSPQVEIIEEYLVINRTIDVQNEQHAMMWNLISGLMHPDDLEHLSAFTVFTDYLGNRKAFLKRLPGKDRVTPNAEFALHVDYMDAFLETGQWRNYEETLHILIHEYAHVLTLNQTQLDETGRESRPIGYDRGAFLEGSYMDLFYETFWADIIEYWETLSHNDFYQIFQDRFVTRYAASKASEDICESFVAFVLSDPPSQSETIADEKRAFFYSFDSMVQAREHIRAFLQLDDVE